MSVVAESILEIARQLEPAGTAEASLRRVLANEIRRRLNRYNLIDRQFRRKYGLSFQEFDHRDVVEEQDYSWEVEADYCDWEMAVTGIEALKAQLAELENRDR